MVYTLGNLSPNWFLLVVKKVLLLAESRLAEYLGKMARHVMDYDAHTADQIDADWACRSSCTPKREEHPPVLVSFGMMLDY